MKIRFIDDDFKSMPKEFWATLELLEKGSPLPENLLMEKNIPQSKSLFNISQAKHRRVRIRIIAQLFFLKKDPVMSRVKLYESIADHIREYHNELCRESSTLRKMITTMFIKGKKGRKPQDSSPINEQYVLEPLPEIVLIRGKEKLYCFPLLKVAMEQVANYLLDLPGKRFSEIDEFLQHFIETPLVKLYLSDNLYVTAIIKSAAKKIWNKRWLRSVMDRFKISLSDSEVLAKKKEFFNFS